MTNIHAIFRCNKPTTKKAVDVRIKGRTSPSTGDEDVNVMRSAQVPLKSIVDRDRRIEHLC